MAKAYFNTLSIPFCYAVDAQADRYADHPAWQGVSVLKPADVPSKHRSRVSAGHLHRHVLLYGYRLHRLRLRSWSDIVPFYDVTQAYTDRYPIHNGWFAGELDSRDLQENRCPCFRGGRTTHPGRTICKFIAWHLLREDLVFPQAPVNTQNRYFIDEMTCALQDDEVFLDGGAHHGEVSFRFAQMTAGRFKRIYAIEPDPENLRIFSEKLREKPASLAGSIELMDIALGKQAGVAPFAGGLGYASQFSPNAPASLRVQTLDDLRLPATFIKLHLEGWEYEALAGGIKTLNQTRPMLVVTTYHNPNGLWRVYSLLMNKLSGYVFLLRLHAWNGNRMRILRHPAGAFQTGVGAKDGVEARS